MSSFTVKVKEAVNMHAMKVCGGVEVQLHPLSWTQDGCPSNFTCGESASSNYCLGGWAGPTAGLDALKKRQIFAPVGKPMMI
jgi:hypothetical protein